MTCCNAIQPAPMSRRRALQAVALGAGVSLLSMLRPGVAKAGGHTEMLLLTCMDFRLANEIEAYMDARGLRDKYDHVVLAGASLGALNDRFPAWTEVFWQHLDLAIELHEVHRVMVLDHRDCGAYKMILGEASVKDPETELKSHVKQLYALRSAILAKHPHMEVEIGLMALDGAVMQIV
ncbi:MAG: carbonic anhydrase [Caulobacter sp.]